MVNYLKTALYAGCAIALLSSCSNQNPSGVSVEQTTDDSRVSGINDMYNGAELRSKTAITLSKGTTYQTIWRAKPARGKSAVTLFSMYDETNPWTESLLKPLAVLQMAPTTIIKLNISARLMAPMFIMQKKIKNHIFLRATNICL
jgi:hypothetical protein